MSNKISFNDLLKTEAEFLRQAPRQNTTRILRDGGTYAHLFWSLTVDQKSGGIAFSYEDSNRVICFDGTLDLPIWEVVGRYPSNYMYWIATRETSTTENVK